jgi:hypothetical protein
MIISLSLMVFFMIFVLPDQAADSAKQTGNERSPDLTFFYTPDDLYQMAEEYGDDGRQAYIQSRWTFDLIFPLVYSAYLTFGISWFIQRLDGWADGWKLTNLLPLLGGIFDLLENSGATVVMSIFPNRSEFALIFTSIVSPIKWILVSSSFIPYFLFGAVWLFQRFKLRNSRI